MNQVQVPRVPSKRHETVNCQKKPITIIKNDGKAYDENHDLIFIRSCFWVLIVQAFDFLAYTGKRLPRRSHPTPLELRDRHKFPKQSIVTDTLTHASNIQSLCDSENIKINMYLRNESPNGSFWIGEPCCTFLPKKNINGCHDINIMLHNNHYELIWNDVDVLLKNGLVTESEIVRLPFSPEPMIQQPDKKGQYEQFVNPRVTERSIAFALFCIADLKCEIAEGTKFIVNSELIIEQIERMCKVTNFQSASREYFEKQRNEQIASIRTTIQEVELTLCMKRDDLCRQEGRLRGLRERDEHEKLEKLLLEKQVAIDAMRAQELSLQLAEEAALRDAETSAAILKDAEIARQFAEYEASGVPLVQVPVMPVIANDFVSFNGKWCEDELDRTFRSKVPHSDSENDAEIARRLQREENRQSMIRESAGGDFWPIKDGFPKFS